MKNFNTLCAALAAAGIIATVIIERQARAEWQAGENSLQEQSNLLAALTKDRERLSKLAAHATPKRFDDNAAELAKLRAELASLQKQMNDLAGQTDTNDPARASRSASPIWMQRPLDYWTKLHLLAGTRTQDAMALANAWCYYADDHDKQSPASLDDLKAYIAQNNQPFAGTNQFEIVYQGSLDDLKGIPQGSVAVVRELQPWPGPDGTMMRVYGFMCGTSQIVSSDNVQAFEAQHVISAAPPGSSSQ
jgi:hypothetical protein